MEAIKLFRVKEEVADSIIEPALNPPLSIDIKNITVSFPSSKEGRDHIPDRPLRVW